MGDSHRQSLDAPKLKGGANISVDVDGLACYRAIHGLSRQPEGPDPLWQIGVQRAADLFAEFDLPATFFVVGRDLEVSARADQARKLVGAGHELANHSYDHLYNLRRLSPVEINYQIGATDRIIADVTGHRPLGFRTPGYNVSADLVAASRRSGHRYDASVFPCPSYWGAKAAIMGLRSLQGRPSRSDRTDPKSLTAPRQPYWPDPLNIWEASGEPSPYIEIPVAVLAGRMMPMIGTSLHLLAPLGIKRVWKATRRAFPDFFNLEMHAIDFVDATDLADVPDVKKLVAHQGDLKIPWEKKAARYRQLFALICQDRQMVTLAEATSQAADEPQ